MTRRDVLFAIGSSVTASAIAGCGLVAPHWVYRYRLTLEVDTPNGVKTGASVIEVRRKKAINGAIEGKVQGEAAVVDLGDRGLLFALLRGERGGPDWPFSFIHRPLAALLGTEDMVSETALDKLVRLQGTSLELTPPDYPTLVRFRDPRDPRSVEAVDPANLAASFGPGVRLKRIVVQVTDDPVTTGIDKVLPSFGPETGFDNWYRQLPLRDPRHITLDEFKTG